MTVFLHLLANALNPAPGIHSGRCFRTGMTSTRNRPGATALVTMSKVSSESLIIGSLKRLMRIPYATAMKKPPMQLRWWAGGGYLHYKPILTRRSHTFQYVNESPEELGKSRLSSPHEQILLFYLYPDRASWEKDTEWGDDDHVSRCRHKAKRRRNFLFSYCGNSVVAVSIHRKMCAHF